MVLTVDGRGPVHGATAMPHVRRGVVYHVGVRLIGAFVRAAGACSLGVGTTAHIITSPARSSECVMA